MPKRVIAQIGEVIDSDARRYPFGLSSFSFHSNARAGKQVDKQGTHLHGPGEYSNRVGEYLHSRAGHFCQLGALLHKLGE